MTSVKAASFDERLLESADWFGGTHSDEAQMAIEVALEMAGGSHAAALELIVSADLVCAAAKAIAGEVLA